MQTNSTQTHPETAASGSYQSSVGQRGSENMRVAREWAKRPKDECFLSLDDMYRARKSSAEHREEVIIDKASIGLIPEGCDGDVRLDLAGESVWPTNWAFSQLSKLAGAPPQFLRKLSPETATRAFNESWQRKQSGLGDLKAYRSDNQIHAVTSLSYGRLYDHSVIEAVQEIAGSGQGENHWKVPGVLDWQTGRYDPNKPVTESSTTLFGSDRDIFLFLVDDTRPIQIGTLPSGDPDHVFRGFYVWNSEMGAATVGCATFLLRGVCANRILWGCENHQEIRLRHDHRAPERFLREVAPALQRYSEASADDVQIGIQNAQKAIVVQSVEDRVNFLVKQQFSKSMAAKIVKAHIDEEHFAPVSAWDFVQAITAYAKQLPHQDKRLMLEKKAAKLMSAV